MNAGPLGRTDMTLPTGPPAARPTAGIRRHTALNVAGSMAPLLLAIVTLPLYLEVIGTARYGVLSIVWLLVGYFGFVGAGLGRSTAHHVARRRAGAQRETEDVFWTALAVNTAVGVAGGAVLFILSAVLFASIITVPAGIAGEIHAALPWMAAVVPVVSIAAVTSGALEGQERFVSANLLAIMATALVQVAPVVVAIARGPDLPALVATVVVVRLLVVGVSFAVCARSLPLRGRPRIEPRLVRPLASFGGWIAGSFFVIPFLTTLDQVMIGALLGVQWVAPYAIAYNLAIQLLIIPASLSRALFPRFSMLDHGAIREVAQTAITGLAVLIAPLVVAAILMLDPVLHAWIGPELAGVAGPAGRILLVGIWFNSLAFIPFAWLQGEGRPRVAAALHLAQLGPYAAVLWLGITAAGVPGAAWAWVVRSAVDAVLLLWAVRAPRGHFRELLLPTGVIGVAAVGSFLVEWTSPLGIVFGLGCIGVVAVWAWRSTPESFAELIKRTPWVARRRRHGSEQLGGPP